MRSRIVIGLVTLSAAHTQLWGTTLVFQPQTGSFGTEQPIPQAYGDRVVATTQDGYLYGSEGGFTPNVVVDWNTGTSPLHGNAVHYPTGFGDLVHVFEVEPEGRGVEVTFTADQGWFVELHGFDMAGWNRADYTINAVRVLDGAGQTLFEQTDVPIAGSGPSHSDFDFTPGLVAPIIKIQFDSRNLGGSSDNIGMDNITFGQVPAPPGDFNFDRHVDLIDFEILLACVSGPNVAYDIANLPAGCTLTADVEAVIAADFDRDGDVDADDFGIWQLCYSGPEAFGDPSCAEN